MPIYKIPGEAFGATIRFRHRGPAENVWIGFGMGFAHQDPVAMQIVQFLGAWIPMPADADWMDREVQISGNFPDIFTPGKAIDCNKIVAPYEPPFTAETLARRYDDDWDDEVYFVPPQEFEISTPESTYF